MSDPFLGEIKVFGFNFPPRGYMLCQGQQMNVSQNTALFSLLSTFYGGDGVQMFKLPDLRGRTAIAFGQGLGLSPYNIGQTTGAELTQLNQANLPAHTHTAVTQVQGTVTNLAAVTTVNAMAGPSTRVIPPGDNFITSPVTAGASPIGVQAFAASGSGTVTALNSGTATTTVSGGTLNASATTTNAVTGQNAPFSTLQPLLAINYSIATVGIYPSRN